MPRFVLAPIAAFSLAVALVLAGRPAAASLPYNDFAGVCTPTRLTVQPIAAGVPDRDGGEPDTKDCALPDGTAIRLRWVTDLPFPVGECGAAPPEYVDLWIGKRRVLTRYSISEGCAGLELQSLTADARQVRLCTYVPKDARTHRDATANATVPTVLPASRAEGRSFHVKCRDLPVDPTAPIDAAEFPATSAPAIATPPIVTPPIVTPAAKP